MLASNTAPALTSLMVFISGWYSRLIRLQVFSIAEFIISRDKTKAIQSPTHNQSPELMCNRKPAIITMPAITACNLPFCSVVKKDLSPEIAYTKPLSTLTIYTPNIIQDIQIYYCNNYLMIYS